MYGIEPLLIILHGVQCQSKQQNCSHTVLFDHHRFIFLDGLNDCVVCKLYSKDQVYKFIKSLV